jgi:hypothetical protein
MDCHLVRSRTNLAGGTPIPPSSPSRTANSPGHAARVPSRIGSSGGDASASASAGGRTHSASASATFANSAPLLVVSSQAIAALNAHVGNIVTRDGAGAGAGSLNSIPVPGGQGPRGTPTGPAGPLELISAAHFRPNMVVSEWGAASTSTSASVAPERALGETSFVPERQWQSLMLLRGVSLNVVRACTRQLLAMDLLVPSGHP